MMTLTRCSSTPSADTFMNPDGSTRLTRLERLVTAPLLDQDGIAGRDPHGVCRQEIGHDLEASGIADPSSGSPTGDRRTRESLQDDAAHRRDDVYRRTSSA
jgi:hypothetical protein